MSNPQRLATCVTCHAWNGDKSRVAFCPDNNEVHIYKKSGNKLEKEFVLKEHTMVVTAIDWAPKSNRIVTCSQDRNAYVWKFENNAWHPTLVILRMNRAATCVRWSPDENKFAVGSSAKIVSVCYFEEENDWWVSKHIKGHRSTVTCVAWHPSSLYIATGSTGFRARTFCAFIKGLDQRPSGGVFGGKPAFGAIQAEYPTGGWVHDIAFAPNGNTFAFVTHDSRVNFVDISSGEVNGVVVNALPYRSCLYLDDGTFVAAGYDCNVALFKGSGTNFKFVKDLDEGKGSGGGAAKSNAAQKRALWNNRVNKGESSTAETTLNTIHQNAISWLSPAAGGFSSTGVDGRIVFWKP